MCENKESRASCNHTPTRTKQSQLSSNESKFKRDDVIHFETILQSLQSSFVKQTFCQEKKKKKVCDLTSLMIWSFRTALSFIQTPSGGGRLSRQLTNRTHLIIFWQHSGVWLLLGCCFSFFFYHSLYKKCGSLPPTPENIHHVIADLQYGCRASAPWEDFPQDRNWIQDRQSVFHFIPAEWDEPAWSNTSQPAWPPTTFSTCTSTWWVLLAKSFRFTPLFLPSYKQRTWTPRVLCSNITSAQSPNTCHSPVMYMSMTKVNAVLAPQR